MRHLTALATFLAATALGYAGGALGLVLTAPPPHLPEASASAGPAARQDTADRAAVSSWAALFGTPPPRDAAPAPPEPAEDYTLVGLVVLGPQSWAMIGHDGGEFLARKGSRLPGGEIVRAIDAAGVEIEHNGRRKTIGFDAEDLALADGGLGMLRREPETRRREIPLSDLLGQNLARLFGSAGSVRVTTKEGTRGPAMHIVWVRDGGILDRIGLRQGDQVLRVNGLFAGDLDNLAEVAAQIGQVREFDIEVERGGIARILKVVTVGEG